MDTRTTFTPELVRGAAALEATERGVLPHRLPAPARAQGADPQLSMSESQPSGVRVVFRTRASTVELDVVPLKRIYGNLPPRPDGVYDLLVNGELAEQTTVPGGDTIHTDLATGTTRVESGSTGTARFTALPEGPNDVEIWLPHNETTELVALRADATIEPLPAPRRRIWLHHGSSISHGSDAASPTTTWPALAAARGDVDLVNLGLGGSAMLDPFTARAMRGTTADLISVKIGINLVNADLMRLRGFTAAMHGFLDTVREGHPDTPLLVISPIHCPIHEDTPGPCSFDFEALSAGKLRLIATGDPADRSSGKLTLRAIRAELARIVEQRSTEDERLHYLDGEELYGPTDAAQLPLPDNLHPDAETHRNIGERFAEFAFAANGPFGPNASRR